MRLALGISYLGTAYHGWQSQHDGQTVQDTLEHALGAFAQTSQHLYHSSTFGRISTLCAGRTDSGVHALRQVVHFDTEVERPMESWVRGVNAHLPKDVAVHWAKVVPRSFHCRASALTRSYAYILLECPVRPTLDGRRVGWTFRKLNLQAMQTAAQHLIGEHDFSSFRAAQCQALSPIKRLLRIDINTFGQEDHRYWRFEFEANAFLHHMIRNIMGCLVAVGTAKQTPAWLKSVLEAKNRHDCAPTFSPDGLYFLGPTYDAKWDLPKAPPFAYGWIGS